MEDESKITGGSTISHDSGIEVPVSRRIQNQHKKSNG